MVIAGTRVVFEVSAEQMEPIEGSRFVSDEADLKEVALRKVAACHESAVVLPGRVLETAGGGRVRLAVVQIDPREASDFVLIDLGQQPPLAYTWDRYESFVVRGQLLESVVISSRNGGSKPEWLSSKRAMEELESTGLLTQVGRLGKTQMVAARLVAACSMFVVSQGGYVTVNELPEEPIDYSRQQIESLREMQRLADAVYGRLEKERALSWALEELGEVSQTLRRDEGRLRASEEIGQLFSWVLCLANIAQVDLAFAGRSALRHEVMRQMSTYGQLKPYGGKERHGPSDPTTRPEGTALGAFAGVPENAGRECRPEQSSL